MKRYLWLTDTHFNWFFPWYILLVMWQLFWEQPDGIFLTGDISNGRSTCFHLSLLARLVKCPIYFVIGNHDRHYLTWQQSTDKLRELCREHKNLIWMTDQEVIPLNEEVALIGEDGWYDCVNGNPNYLKLTFDWWKCPDFRKMKNMEERIAAWKQLAQQSAENIARKLEKAIEQDYKTIYILTHCPIDPIATRDLGTLFEKFWLPYNCNLVMGETIKEVMEKYKKKHCVVWAGHIHCAVQIHISRNIECRVGKNRKKEVIYV